MSGGIYFFSEHDDLVPTILLLLGSAPPGSQIVIQDDKNMPLVTVTKKKSNAFVVRSHRAEVTEILDRLEKLVADMRGGKILRPEFAESEESGGEGE
jgi:hypothetical protein